MSKRKNTQYDKNFNNPNYTDINSYTQYFNLGGPIDPPKNIEPTYADSLALYNNALIKNNFYNSNPDYHSLFNGDTNFQNTNFQDPNVRLNLIESAEAYNDSIIDDALINLMIKNAKDEGSPLSSKEKEEIKKTKGQRRFGTVPGTNLTSFGDILAGDADGYFNPLAPPIYLHPNISPQGSDYYWSERVLDASEVPHYDPLAVAPWDILTDKQKEERVLKYGTSGVPKSYIKENSQSSNEESSEDGSVSSVPDPVSVPKRPEQPVLERLNPLGVGNNQIPERNLATSTVNIPKGSRKQPIMRADNFGNQGSRGNSAGQYQIGERVWDDVRKSWVDKRWNKEERQQSRKLAKENSKMKSQQTDLGYHQFKYGGDMKNKYMFGGLAHGAAKALGANDDISNVAGLVGSGLGMLVNPMSGMQGMPYAMDLAGMGNSENTFMYGGSTNKYNQGGQLMSMQGPSHEEGGINIGNNNEVEGGEVMTNDFVFTDELGPQGKKGLTYAKLADKIRKKQESRPGDSITKESTERELQALIQQHESDPKILAAREKQQTQQFKYGGVKKYNLGGGDPTKSLLNPDYYKNLPYEEKVNLYRKTSDFQDLHDRLLTQPNLNSLSLFGQPSALETSANNLKLRNLLKDSVTVNDIDRIPVGQVSSYLNSEGGSNWSKPGIQDPQLSLPANYDGYKESGEQLYNIKTDVPRTKVKDRPYTPYTPDTPDTPIEKTNDFNLAETLGANAVGPYSDPNNQSLKTVAPNKWGYAANALGPLAQGLYAGMTPAENTQFERVQAPTLDMSPARQELQRQGSLSRANLNRQSAGARTIGSNMAMNTAGNVGINRGIGSGMLQSYGQERMFNAQAGMQANMANANISMQERIANEQNRAARRSMISGAIGDLGTGLAGAVSENTAMQAQDLMNRRGLNMANSMYTNYYLDPNMTVNYRR